MATPDEMKDILEMEEKARVAFGNVLSAIEPLNDKEGIAVLGMVQSDLSSRRSVRHMARVLGPALGGVIEEILGDTEESKRIEIHKSLGNAMEEIIAGTHTRGKCDKCGLKSECDAVVGAIESGEGIEGVLKGKFDKLTPEQIKEATKTAPQEVKALVESMLSGSLPENIEVSVLGAKDKSS